jgi:enoyl-CoA hydratase/carnithine racemase
VTYADFEALSISLQAGIATVTMRFQGEDERTRRLQAIQHRELVQIWRELDRDPEVRVALMDVAYDYAHRLAKAPPVALRFTKRGINQWLKLAEIVSQDFSLALESLADYSRAREGNPHTEWPPRHVPDRRP